MGWGMAVGEGGQLNYKGEIPHSDWVYNGGPQMLISKFSAIKLIKMISEATKYEGQYSAIKTKFAQFLHNFKKHDRLIYKQSARSLLSQGKYTLLISISDLMNFSADLSDNITQEFYRLEPHLNDAVSSFVWEIERTEHMQEERQGAARAQVRSKYYVGFEGFYPEEVRALNCSHLGKLTCMKGTVTRTTEVRPELIMGVFRCKGCDTLSPKIPQQFKYTEPKKCRRVNCDSNRWQLEAGQSQFADYQKIRVQQDPMSIPPGSMPRSIDIILRNDIVEKAQPGDLCQFTGQLAVLPDVVSMLKPGDRTQVIVKNTESRGNAVGMDGVTGLSQTGVKDLNYKLIYVANWVRVENNSFNDEREAKEEDEEEENIGGYTDEKEMERICRDIPTSKYELIRKMKNNPNIFDALAESLFPAIFGHTQIKKAILLQLLSGVHKTTETRLNIRGDLNVLIVGDPSTAKSQFLKSVQQFMPRSVYTSGKTTSAAGLTATVTRDENGEVGIEAGALMLADNGVCCIDEFDKMDTKDQVAIHQAMEQQTISIAKAGIYATLNARTSILAAANPIFGRYDKTKSLMHNINLSTPIMSRFDLFFVICDQSNQLHDQHVGKFILNMHRNKQTALEVIYQTSLIKQYMKIAKRIKPRLTHQSAELLRLYYTQLRQHDKNIQNNSYRITVRQLQSLIRLSQAIARLYMNFEIRPEYVQLAYKLMNCSIMKVEKDPYELDEVLMKDELERMKIAGRGDKLKGTNLMELEAERRQNEKKREQFKISHQQYSQIQKYALELFRAKEKELRDITSDDQPCALSQAQIVEYIISQNVSSISSQDELNRYKKIAFATLRWMTEKDRVLTIHELNDNPEETKLVVHPNYSQTI